MAETSDMKFLNTCRRLLDIFSADPKWNPSNAALDSGKLEQKLNDSYPIAQDVLDKNAPQEIKINQRQETYAKFSPRVRASRRYLRSCGANAAEIADANTIINKILGVRSTPAAKIKLDQPGPKVEKTISASHMSYDSRLGNLQALRAFYANVTAYKPNENPIKLDGFDELITEAQNANNAVSTGYVPLLTALNLRDAKLYTDPDSTLEIYRDAKEYYKSLYEPSSPQYRAITAKSMSLESNSRR